MIPQLGADPEAPFPACDSALPEPDGLLAWGGDLHPARLTRAYRRGIFPWYSAEQPILWWCPSRRAVLLPEDVYVSRRLARKLRQDRYRVTADQAFEAVIDGCARPRLGQPGTWITPDMRAAYLRLHEGGLAHSVEVWDGERLVGGIYGLAIGSAVFGESMFSEVPDASKLALVA
ncbi:MAG: leucyl/phenylalanyl-tRNA--protein transferase, partial [Xanthomonadales bacterium]|nr:leucyl/phenylalanyl-tRNA--protein transferase [Xanthomonadales bacterium]